MEYSFALHEYLTQRGRTMRPLISFSTIVISAFCLVGTASAEPIPVETIRALTEKNTKPAIALFREFLSLPNDANYPDDIARKAVGEKAPAEVVEQWKKNHGYDRPPIFNRDYRTLGQRRRRS